MVRAVQVALPGWWPRSAAAAEMHAVRVALEILARGTSSGLRHVPGSIRLFSDCEAVVKVAARRDRYKHSEKFCFACCWEGFSEGPIGPVVKVAAHRSEAEALREGWQAVWKGNDLADGLAKAACPTVAGWPDEWVAARRTRRRVLSEACAAVPYEPLRSHLVVPRKNGNGPRREGGLRTGAGHTPFFLDGKWVCSTCGLRFRSRRECSGSAAGVCVGRFKVLQGVRPSHRPLVGRAVPASGSKDAGG